MTIKEWQNTVDHWIKTYGVRYFDPLTNMAILTEETGEVARIMARRFGEQSIKKGTELGDLADELADLVWVVTCIANQTGVDLEAALSANLEKKSLRDRDRHRQNPLLQTSPKMQDKEENAHEKHQ